MEKEIFRVRNYEFANMDIFWLKKIGDAFLHAQEWKCGFVTLQQQKRQTYSEPRTERVEWDISVANVNVNVLINFILFVMQRHVSMGKEIPHCNIEMYTYCYIFLNVLGKKTRRWKAKSHGYSFRIPCRIQTIIRWTLLEIWSLMAKDHKGAAPEPKIRQSRRQGIEAVER